MPARVLVFGGTFDPPHRAHVELPRLVAERLGCDRIVYVPAAINPLKTDAPPAGAAHRLAMLGLAIRDVPNAVISTVEIDREGPSYFIDTIRALRETLDAGAVLHFLIGADQALDFRRWRAWEEILAEADPAVVLRPPWSREPFAAALRERWGAERARWWLARTIDDAPLIDVSASDLRMRLARGDDAPELVAPEVAEYARRHGLYGEGKRE